MKKSQELIGFLCTQCLQHVFLVRESFHLEGSFIRLMDFLGIKVKRQGELKISIKQPY